MAKTILILGASRGIGLGLAQVFLARGWTVIGTERGESAALHATGARVEKADLKDHGSLLALRSRLEGTTLDVLMLNAGIAGPAANEVSSADPAEVADVFMTNAAGPIAAAEILMPLVAEGGTIAFTTSAMGSIAENEHGGYAIYRGSKSALNMMAKCLSVSAEGAKRTTLVLHPGWVQTDMGGPDAAVTVKDSTEGLANVIEGAAGSGGIAFRDFTGRAIPW